MTVNATTALSAAQIADGSNRTWYFPFKIVGDDQIVLYLLDANAHETRVTSGYTVIGVGSDNGGEVTYPLTPTAPLASGISVKVGRNVVYEQPDRLGNQGPYLPRIHEGAFDRLEMQIQQVAEITGRSLTTSPFTPPGTVTLPPAEPGTVLIWDANGNLTNSSADVGDFETSAQNAQAAAEIAMAMAASASDAAAAATSAALHPSQRPTLRGYFGVDPANEEEAQTRMQDAARSGMNVFVEPGIYRLGEQLLFDGPATVFRGAGSMLTTFAPVSMAEVMSLFYVKVSGCAVSGVTFDASGSSVTTSLYATDDTSTTVNDHFQVHDCRFLGGDNGLGIARTRKANISNVFCEGQGGHGVVIFHSSMIDLNVDGLVCHSTGGEALSVSDFVNAPSSVVVEAGERIIIRNLMAYNCLQAFDAYLTTTRLLMLDNIISDRNLFAAIEIKCKLDEDNPVTNPNRGVELISISNLKIISTAAGSGAVAIDWGDTPGTDVARKIEMSNITADVPTGVTTPPTLISLQGQSDIAISGYRVSGPAANMLRIATGSAGTAATRINLEGLVTVGTEVTGGILVDTVDGVDGLILRNSNIAVTASPLRFNLAYAKGVSLENCLLESTVNGRPVHATNSVVELTVDGGNFKSFDHGIYLTSFTTGPALAALPNVSGCVTSAGLIKVTFASAHGLASENAISIAGVTGTTEANGVWLVTVVDSDEVTLQESVFTNAYVSGGTARRASKVALNQVTFRKGGGSALRADHGIYAITNGCRCNTPVSHRGNYADDAAAKVRSQMLRGYLNAAPVSTAGGLGDYFLNHTPVAGGPTGWMCVTAGAAGAAVWKAMASLAA